MHVVAADLGFRSDASAAVALRVERCDATRRAVLVDWLELRPQGVALRPSDVCGRVAQLAKNVGCGLVWSDYHYSETLKEELARHRVQLMLGPTGSNGKQEVWTEARQMIHAGSVTTPDLPSLLDQLRAVRHRPTPGGGIAIEQPRRRGSHGDLAAAFALALWAASNVQLGPYSYTPVPRRAGAWGRSGIF